MALKDTSEMKSSASSSEKETETLPVSKEEMDNDYLLKEINVLEKGPDDMSIGDQITLSA